MADRTTGHATDADKMTLEQWDETKQAIYVYLHTYGPARVIDLMAEFDMSYEDVQTMMGEINAEHPEVQKGHWQASMW